MAELCTAFKRIVPRYQFSKNKALYKVEDMKDAAIKRRSGGFRFRGSSNTHNNHLHNTYCSTMDTCKKLRFIF